MKSPLLRLFPILLIIPLLLTLWLLIKPWRVKKADFYLKSDNLISAQKASILTPLSPLVHLEIGEKFKENGNLDAAEKEFKKVIFICQKLSFLNKSLKNSQDFYQAIFNLNKIEAKKAMDLRDIQKAEENLAKGLEINQSDSEINYLFALVLMEKDDFEQAKDYLILANNQNGQILLQTLKKIPNTLNANPYSLALIGLSLLQIDEPNLAISQFQKAKEIDPDYRDAYVLLGQVYLERSAISGQRLDLEKAKEELEKAAEIDPVYPKTFYLLSKVYEKLKEKDKASEAVEKAKMLEFEK